MSREGSQTQVSREMHGQIVQQGPLGIIKADLARLWREPKFRLIALFFAILMILFSVQRAAVLAGINTFFHDAPRTDIIKAFGVGIRFDLVIALMAVLPLIGFIFVPAGWVRNKVLQIVVCWYCGAVLASAVFACIADFYFFRQFAERLNNKALEYLEYSTTYKMLWHSYPLGKAVLFAAALALGGYKLCRNIGFKFARQEHGPGLGLMLAWIAVIVCGSVLGIRGTLKSKPINTGLAYFTRHAATVQLAQNGVFGLREAVISQLSGQDVERAVSLLPRNVAVEIARTNASEQGTKWVENSVNPLHRITDTGKKQENYNVVLVIMEGLSWHYVGEMGGIPGLTPNLDRMIREGVFMDRCFAVGSRTVRGMAAIVCSYPDLPGKGVMTRLKSENSFITLGSVLAKRGYETEFVYAGQGIYDHRQAFLGSNGFSKMVFEEELKSRTFRTDIGYCDEDLFYQLNDEMSRAREKPVFALALTLSYHVPFEYPAGKIEEPVNGGPNSKEMGCIRYVDWCVGEFIQQARKEKYFDNTIFVFVSDHMSGFREMPHTPDAYRVPFLVYAPKILKPQRISTICSQMDVAPTIMRLLGGSYEHCFFGSDVIGREEQRGMAFIQNNEEITTIDSKGNILVMPRNASPVLMRLNSENRIAYEGYSPETKDLLRNKSTSIVQIADELFQKRAFNVGPQNKEVAGTTEKAQNKVLLKIK